MAQPDLILVPFAANAPAANVDAIPVSLGPSDPPQAASWSQGFPQVTMTPLAAGGIPPRGQSFNGLFQDITEHLVFIGGGGQYKWTQAYVTAKGGYSKGDVIQSNDGTFSCVSLTDNNTTNFNTTPSSIGTLWKYWGAAPLPIATETQNGLVVLASQSRIDTGAGAYVVTADKFGSSIQGQRNTAFTSSGTGSALVLTPSPAITTYAANQRFSVSFHAASGATPAMNISGQGSKLLKQYNSTGAKVAAVFAAGQISDVIYDGVDLVMINRLVSDVAAASESVAGVIGIATPSEATGGAADNKAMTPLKTKAVFAARGLWDVSITGTVNANLARSTGMYSLNGATNGPPGTNTNFQMLSSDWGADPTWQSQLALGISDNSMFMRSIKKDQSIALPWVRCWTSGDFAMIGASVAFYSSTPPNGWLKENGAAVSRTTYAALFALIGTTYGAGDGSTTFNLPDHRGEFPRGWSDGSTIDAGRVLGSKQAQDYQSHNHAIIDKATAFTFGSGGAGAGNAPGGRTTGQTELSGGTETRPRNIAKLYCIKF